MKKDLYEIIEKEMNKLNVTDVEATNIIKQLRHGESKRKTFSHLYGNKRVKIGIISDTHIGTKYFDYQAFDDSIKIFNRERVEAIYHAGDVIEGMSNRDGHMFELSHFGVTSQMNHAVELLSQYKQPLFFTTGNHDEWSKKKANQGFDVGPELEAKLSNAKFLGEYNADILFADNVKMRLTHDGNTAYALSYSGQKKINGLSGGDKPNIMVNGHLHKMLEMFYRNIHFMEAGTFQKQTPFMAMKGSPAMVGFYVLDVKFNKAGVTELNTKRFPYY